MKTMELYHSQKKVEVPDIIYFQKYNRMILTVEPSLKLECNTFRFLYIPKIKLLSIHYYDDVYAELDSFEYNKLNSYVKNYVYVDKSKDSSKVIKEAKIFMQRNIKLVKKAKDRSLQVINKLALIIIPKYNAKKLLYGNGQEDIIVAKKRITPEESQIELRLHKPFIFKKALKTEYGINGRKQYFN